MYLSEILQLHERKRGKQYLYHACNLEWLLIALIQNQMGGGTAYDYFKGTSEDTYNTAISFSRDPSFYLNDEYFGNEEWPFIMVFDRDKLAQKYKLEPYHDANTDDRQAEEILPDRLIKNVKSYIEEVDITHEKSFKKDAKDIGFRLSNEVGGYNKYAKKEIDKYDKIMLPLFNEYYKKFKNREAFEKFIADQKFENDWYKFIIGWLKQHVKIVKSGTVKNFTKGKSNEI
jgi:hypothetical protein